MNIPVPPELEARLNAIASRTGRDAADLAVEALDRYLNEEQRRAELLADLGAAEASLARGEGRVITRESMQALAEEVKQRGRTRLAEERAAAG